mmetsp:Transcript_8055/g.22551  ORF Transcript_8055/g.22551 Transcript_8055/m.22551 type:complete len:343 (-) Transcript_8055:379-1407(-)
MMQPPAILRPLPTPSMTSRGLVWFNNQFSDCPVAESASATESSLLAGTIARHAEGSAGMGGDAVGACSACFTGRCGGNASRSIGARSSRMTTRMRTVAPLSRMFHAVPLPGGTWTPSVTGGHTYSSCISSAGGGPAQAPKAATPVSGLEKTTLKYVSWLPWLTNQASPRSPAKTSSLASSSLVTHPGCRVRRPPGFGPQPPDSNQSPSSSKASLKRLSISKITWRSVKEARASALGVPSASVVRHQRAFRSLQASCSGTFVAPSAGRMMHRITTCSSCSSSVSQAQPSARRSAAPGRAMSGTWVQSARVSGRIFPARAVKQQAVATGLLKTTTRVCEWSVLW